MKAEKERLYKVLEKAVSEKNEIHLKEEMTAAGIGRVCTADLREVCVKITKAHPECRIVRFVSRINEPASLYENGVLTCCEYDDGDDAEK